VELHTILPLIHYLPPPIHRALLRRLGFEFFAKEENLNLLDKRTFLALLDPAIAHRCTVGWFHFLGLPSNILLSYGGTRAP